MEQQPPRACIDCHTDLEPKQPGPRCGRCYATWLLLRTRTQRDEREVQRMRHEAPDAP